MRLIKFPIVLGISKSSLWCTSKVVNCVQLPISEGKCSMWLLETSNVTKRVNFPIPPGKSLILFSLKLSMVKFYMKKFDTNSAMLFFYTNKCIMLPLDLISLHSLFEYDWIEVIRWSMMWAYTQHQESEIINLHKIKKLYI